MTPLPTPLAFSLVALLLIDSASAWHTEIRDHDSTMLAFGHSRRRAQVAATERESTSTSNTNTTNTSQRRRRKQGGSHLVDADNHRESQSQSRSWHILHSATSPHDLEYSHDRTSTVEVSRNCDNKSTPRYFKRQQAGETRGTPFFRGCQHDDNNTAEEENEMMDLPAVTDVTACMSDFGCF